MSNVGELIRAQVSELARGLTAPFRLFELHSARLAAEAQRLSDEARRDASHRRWLERSEARSKGREAEANAELVRAQALLARAEALKLTVEAIATMKKLGISVQVSIQEGEFLVQTGREEDDQ